MRTVAPRPRATILARRSLRTLVHKEPIPLDAGKPAFARARALSRGVDLRREENNEGAEHSSQCRFG